VPEACQTFLPKLLLGKHLASVPGLFTSDLPKTAIAVSGVEITGFEAAKKFR
jgi:hypothetical protein